MLAGQPISRPVDVACVDDDTDRFIPWIGVAGSIEVAQAQGRHERRATVGNSFAIAADRSGVTRKFGQQLIILPFGTVKVIAEWLGIDAPAQLIRGQPQRIAGGMDKGIYAHG